MSPYVGRPCTGLLRDIFGDPLTELKRLDPVQYDCCPGASKTVRDRPANSL
ncbi:MULTISPECIES: hypothetical protein [unclassified Bradyrhizobium]|uniref:hypothetical protein n=1 Tax=unclassified Bradyrhizobium TaxID=2631580 RepID=UPI00244927A9|nr:MULTISPECIES: hypothetical protein [unclassified Bradyrhizobium]MDH2346210.1 hypothetical protein [Bradyrhizobium sp. SSUT77]MDH2350417.1 hypothetical protein [Bradyrhizobium sp. SSUT112]